MNQIQQLEQDFLRMDVPRTAAELMGRLFLGII